MKKLVFLVLISVSQTLLAQLQRVEPAFWWKGMKNPELQLLLYGKNIANQELTFSDNIKPTKITKVDNPNYLFVTLNTSEINVPKFKIKTSKL